MSCGLQFTGVDALFQPIAQADSEILGHIASASQYVIDKTGRHIQLFCYGELCPLVAARFEIAENVGFSEFLHNQTVRALAN